MRFLRRRVAPTPAEGPLAEVLDAEKSAAAAIAAAKVEAGAWLKAERLAIGRARDAELEAMAVRAAADEEAARQAASARAAAIIAAADRFSRELRALGDGELSTIVVRQVASVIPGPPP